MKLLLDTCISPRSRTLRAAAGHDVTWVGDWDADPGDEAILEIAQRKSRILVTLDKDYWRTGRCIWQPHCGIVRLVDIDPGQQAVACENILARHGDELTSGAIATITRDRIRVRPSEAANDLSDPNLEI